MMVVAVVTVEREVRRSDEDNEQQYAGCDPVFPLTFNFSFSPIYFCIAARCWYFSHPLIFGLQTFHFHDHITHSTPPHLLLHFYFFFMVSALWSLVSPKILAKALAVFLYLSIWE